MAKLRYTFLILLGVLFIGCTHPEKNQGSAPQAKKSVITSRISAHRGGKNIKGYAENCIATMQYLHEKYKGIMFEVDIQETSDGKLVLFHDDGLDRLTGKSGRVDLMTYAQLKKLPLLDDYGNPTDCRTPLLKDALKWADKADATLWLDFKPSASYEEVIAMVHENHAADNVILIAYTIAQATKLQHLAPEMLISAPARNEEEWKWLKDSQLNLEHIIAFTGTRLSRKSLLESIHKAGVKTMLGTLGNLDHKASANTDKLYRWWLKQGYDLFSTDRPVAVWESLHQE